MPAPSRGPTGTARQSTSYLSGNKKTTGTSRSLTGRSRPRTAATSTANDENDIICAIIESRGLSPTVGLSFLNLTTSEAVFCQFADTQTYARTCHKISVFEPSEILYASGAGETSLVSVISENLKVEENGIRVTEIHRKYWTDDAGFSYLDRLAFLDDLESLRMSASGNYFAICCLAAVLAFSELNLNVTFATQTLRIRFESSEGSMMVDLSTISSLELIQNLRNAKSKESLFGLMDQTLTKMGSRVLRSNILQPSTDAAKIAERYEAVDDLAAREEMFSSVREAVANFVDTDRCLSALVRMPTKVDLEYMEQSVNNVLMLKTFIDSIKSVWQSLAGARSYNLQEIRNLCAPEAYAEIEELIRYAINDDVTYCSKPDQLRNQRVFAIRAGVNGFLDVARTTYKEINQDATDLVAKLSEDHEINLDLKFEPGRQFFLRFPDSDVEHRPLPAIFVNVVRRKKWVECQTLELMKMSQKIKDAHNEVISMSDKSIQELIDQVRTRIHPLFKISEAIALLDMLAAFAQIASGQDYAKPELIETLAIKSGRHPIREATQSASQRFVPNDVYATEQNRFQIITGCNMSGKSTYIRSIALMAVMAQTGCFVPASYASFPIFNQLFARISTDSAIEANVSTFSAEMRDIAHILRNIEPRSLVIIDELGRGTSTIDGLAIAIAIAEALIESKAFVWFVTHFRDMPRILAERAGVVNLHLSVNIAHDDCDPAITKLKMTYKISDGPIPAENQFYGLALAKTIHLPQGVIEVAEQVSTVLNERNEQRKTSSRALAVARKRRLVLCLREQLTQARGIGKTGPELRRWLKGLQDEFLVRLEAIEREVEAEGLGFVETTSSVREEGNDALEATTTDQEEEEDAVDEGGRLADSSAVAVKREEPDDVDDDVARSDTTTAEGRDVGANVRIKQEMADEASVQRAMELKDRTPFRSPNAAAGESQDDAIVIDSDDA